MFNKEVKQHRKDLETKYGQLAETHNVIVNKYNRELEAYKSKHSNKWQYKLLEDIGESVLTELGTQGWELVSVTSFSTGDGWSPKYVHMQYSFKRMEPVIPDELQAEWDEKYISKLWELKRQMATIKDQLKD